jgi:hypothetical protein
MTLTKETTTHPTAEDVADLVVFLRTQDNPLARALVKEADKHGLTEHQYARGQAFRNREAPAPEQRSLLPSDDRCGECGFENGHARGCVTRAPRRPVKIDAKVAVPDGTYTVEFADGSYRTLRVRIQPEDSDFMPGQQVVGYLRGSNNDHDYTNFAHLKRGEVYVWKKHRDSTEIIEALRVLVGDPKAAAIAYARQSGRCALCGRTLTVPASIEAGIGPVCAKGAGW